MGKPVERQNYSLSFFILSTLIAICTAWSFFDEYLDRRPWKGYQEQLSAHQKAKASLDLAYFERQLGKGDLKVADPSHPGKTITVAEAKEQLWQLEDQVAKDREEVRRIRAELEQASIDAADADLKVKLLKSEDDGLFYRLQHATHLEANARETARKQRQAGNQRAAEVAVDQAERELRQMKELEEERRKIHEQTAKASEEAAEAAKQQAEVEARLDQKEGQRNRLAAAIENAEEPVVTAKEAVKAALGKGTELTQYWLINYDSAVDRCQNCHAAIDRCGFNQPHEVLAAAAEPDATPEKVQAAYCVNPETLQSYRETASAICGLEWDRAASEKGSLEVEGGHCVKGPLRGRVYEVLATYCGPRSMGAVLAGDEKLSAACLSSNRWAALAPYVEDPKEKPGADGKTWSACALALSAAGEKCVEGAQKDQLLGWLRPRCEGASPSLKSLRELPKACASGEDAKKLGSLGPVLFELPVWARTHPYRGKLLGNNHPPEKFGCTTCHEGQGQQTKGVAGHAFNHGYDDPYWERPMLDLVTHKKFRPKSFGPPASSEGVPGEWAKRQRHFVESSCAKCHTDEVDLEFAPTYSRGRRLVAELGCHGCHPLDVFANIPKLGPTLTDLKKKTNSAFLVTWLSYPKGFRPRTKMPNFWPEALNPDHTVRKGSPEELLRREEVQKIVAYLWKHSDPQDLPPPPPGDESRGKVLVQKVGCRACHTFSPPEKLCTPDQLEKGKSRGTPAEPGECEAPRSLTASAARDFAPNLSNVGLMADPRWLFAWLKNPQAMWSASRMPNLRLSDREAADIVAYLVTLKAGQLFEDPPLLAQEGTPEFDAAAEQGDKLIIKYGCAGCHLVKGHENDPKIGTELNGHGRKTVDLLDFGNAIPNPRLHSWYNFVDLKVRAPRVYRYERVDTRMPQFDLSDDEVEAVMTFLRSRTGDKVPTAYLVSNNQRLSSIARGDQVIEYYNCTGCHLIDGEGGRIRDIYLEDQLSMAPPVLQEQGWRVQPDWFFDFLKDPSQNLRPWLDVRMPTFPFNDEDAGAIVRGFSAKAKVPWPYLSVSAKAPEGKDLEEVRAMVAELRCFACHTSGEPSPDQDRASLAPDFLRAKARLRPDWVAEWIKNPQSLQEGTRMPSFFTPDDFSAQMYPKYFGGSQEKQIQMLRDWVMSLPETQAQPQAAAKAPGAKSPAGGGR
ncbi:MAG: c-type cytochrome [Myxococcales bacterium]|nr:c-type cytochrome [Myxococcales bacterium]